MCDGRMGRCRADYTSWRWSGLDRGLAYGLCMGLCLFNGLPYELEVSRALAKADRQTFLLIALECCPEKTMQG